MCYLTPQLDNGLTSLNTSKQFKKKQVKERFVGQMIFKPYFHY